MAGLDAARRRFLQFCAVGASGVVVNLGIFELAQWAFGDRLGPDMRYAAANATGILVSILTNFLLNDLWTWGDRRQDANFSRVRRLGAFYLVASVGGAIQLGVGYGTRAVLQQMELPFGLDVRRDTLSVLTGIGAATFVNYFLNNAWTFRGSPGASVAPR